MKLFLFLSLICTQAFAKPGPLHHDEVANLEVSKSAQMIKPKNAVMRFQQWNSNRGYCGETSILQAGLNQGQWMSQFNARLICGTGLLQSGAGQFCSQNGSANYNAQVLLENPNPGDSPFANAAQCLKNARLAFETYDYASAPAGVAGAQRYLSWIKKMVIKGNQVTIGVLTGGGDPQYDHEVTVSAIATEHSVTDATYYGDDRLFFEDHGSGDQSFTKGYTFDQLAKTGMGFGGYRILIPGANPIFSATGGDGKNDNPRGITAQNFGFAVSGPADLNHDTLPVTVSIKGSSVNGKPNKADRTFGFNFETPAVRECSNAAPTPMLLSLEVSASQLQAGEKYNLYEYDFNDVSGTGDAAALKIPDANFNVNAKMASRVIAFTAPGPLYTMTVEKSSDHVVAYRCVRANAP